MMSYNSRLDLAISPWDPMHGERKHLVGPSSHLVFCCRRLSPSVIPVFQKSLTCPFFFAHVQDVLVLFHRFSFVLPMCSIVFPSRFHCHFPHVFSLAATRIFNVANVSYLDSQSLLSLWLPCENADLFSPRIYLSLPSFPFPTVHHNFGPSSTCDSSSSSSIVFLFRQVSIFSNILNNVLICSHSDCQFLFLFSMSVWVCLPRSCSLAFCLVCCLCYRFVRPLFERSLASQCSWFKPVLGVSVDNLATHS